MSAATAGTDYLAPPSGTSILKANSGGALANAVAGTDYVAPGTATTFTAKQTFNGSTSVLAAVLANAVEPVTISATAATGTINYDVTTQSVLYYTSNASANWTMNFRASSGTSLDSAMSTGQAVTVVFMATKRCHPVLQQYGSGGWVERHTQSTKEVLLGLTARRRGLMRIRTRF